MMKGGIKIAGLNKRAQGRAQDIRLYVWTYTTLFTHDLPSVQNPSGAHARERKGKRKGSYPYKQYQGIWQPPYTSAIDDDLVH